MKRSLTPYAGAPLGYVPPPYEQNAYSGGLMTLIQRRQQLGLTLREISEELHVPLEEVHRVVTEWLEP